MTVRIEIHNEEFTFPKGDVQRPLNVIKARIKEQDAIIAALGDKLVEVRTTRNLYEGILLDAYKED
tara:strand:+ start:1227 stop:1424 length:198 start_codon:yes stop_codon:yes gene_type:complete